MSSQRFTKQLIGDNFLAMKIVRPTPLKIPGEMIFIFWRFMKGRTPWVRCHGNFGVQSQRLRDGVRLTFEFKVSDYPMVPR